MARGERAGWFAGLMLAPLTGSLSALRQSRMFHPRGVVCAGEGEPLVQRGPARAVGERLAGPVLLRWSSAWWKSREWPDVLGCALRFTRAPLGAEPKPGDQDLLLATIGRPWTMPLAPLTTRQHDYFANQYFGVSPFEVPSLGRVEWRLTPGGVRKDLEGASRGERLAQAVGAGCSLELEWAPYNGPLLRPASRRFEPLLAIRLTGFVALDQRALHFDAFRAGRGIEPVGFVHAMRRATYWTSQHARPSGR